MFDVYNGTAPVYMTDLCSRCSDDHLRSSARRNFLVRRTRTRFANSSFTVAEPAALNSLPAHIRTIDSHSAFCHLLKTYLFTVPDVLSLTVGLYLHTGVCTLNLLAKCLLYFILFFLNFKQCHCKVLLSTG